MARPLPPTRWICPLCERSVPPDVPTCHCGTSRAAVLAYAQRERQRKARPFPWVALLGELAVVAFGLYWVLAPNDTPEATPPPATVAIPTPSATVLPTAAAPSADPKGASTPVPVAAAQPRADVPEPAPRPAPTVASGPSPAPLAKPERTEMDLEREAGEKRLEQSLARLATVMARLSENAGQFEAICLGRRGDPRSCARLHEDMASAGESLARGLEGAEDESRHAWVPPGVVRDLRLKHGLEEDAWRDLQERVHRLATQYQGTH